MGCLIHLSRGNRLLLLELLTFLTYFLEVSGPLLVVIVTYCRLLITYHLLVDVRQSCEVKFTDVTHSVVAWLRPIPVELVNLALTFIWLNSVLLLLMLVSIHASIVGGFLAAHLHLLLLTNSPHLLLIHHLKLVLVDLLLIVLVVFVDDNFTILVHHVLLVVDSIHWLVLLHLWHPLLVRILLPLIDLLLKMHWILPQLLIRMLNLIGLNVNFLFSLLRIDRVV